MGWIEIKDRSTGELVLARLVEDVSAEQRSAAQSRWNLFRRANRVGREELASENRLWNWGLMGTSEDEQSCRFFGIRYQGRMQGLLSIDVHARKSRRFSGEGPSLLYIEYIETAPWNQSPPVDAQSSFAYVGVALIRVAIAVSVDAGYEGRLGLHSLEQARNFYQALGFDELFFDREEGYPYLELDAASALSLLA